MTHYICTTCGTQFAGTEEPPAGCPICQDERQYIGPNGQQWTTLAAFTNELVPVLEVVMPRERFRDVVARIEWGSIQSFDETNSILIDDSCIEEPDIE